MSARPAQHASPLWPRPTRIADLFIAGTGLPRCRRLTPAELGAVCVHVQVTVTSVVSAIETAAERASRWLILRNRGPWHGGIGVGSSCDEPRWLGQKPVSRRIGCRSSSRPVARARSGAVRAAGRDRGRPVPCRSRPAPCRHSTAGRLLRRVVCRGGPVRRYRGDFRGRDDRCPRPMMRRRGGPLRRATRMVAVMSSGGRGAAIRSRRVRPSEATGPARRCTSPRPQDRRSRV